MDFYYLLDARSKGSIVTLRFYNAQTGEVLEKRGADYTPYFFLPYPLSEKDELEVSNINGEAETKVRKDLFLNKQRELTKVTVNSPALVRKADRRFDASWETEIRYERGYAYDNDLVFGACYKKLRGKFVQVSNIPSELRSEFEEVFAEIEAIDPQKHAQIERWFNILQQPIPTIAPEHLGIGEIDPQLSRRAFMLARLMNIPVGDAYQSKSVSDWIKSMIHNYLRRHNYLIPTSRELRRGLETHRVPGALTVMPKPGVYFNTVVCDFESLYPSLIDSYNLSYETVDCPHEECKKNKIKECREHWVCTKRRGFYSILVGALKDLRVRWFKPMSRRSEISETERNTSEDLAKLLKLISVSSYGVTVRIHGLACPPLAECITGYGRWALQTTWNLAETEGLHPIYGDTDSIFLDNPESGKIEWLTTTVKEKLRLDLAVEKRYTVSVMPQAKKAYFGILPSGESDIKGLTAIKSNSPQFIHKVFKKCVEKLSNVKTIEDYELAKKRITNVVNQAKDNLKNREFRLEDLTYAVRLYFDPKERLETDVKVTPQAYQCAIQLLDMGERVDRGDTVQFIKVKPFNYKGKKFTVKPAASVQNVKEVNVEDYIRNMTTALEQTFTTMDIKLEQKGETKISDWFSN